MKQKNQQTPIKLGQRTKIPIIDPYAFLLIGILKLALSDIECLQQNKGTDTEKSGGQDAIIWIKEESGTFPLIINALELSNESLGYYTIKKILNLQIAPVNH